MLDRWLANLDKQIVAEVGSASDVAAGLERMAGLIGDVFSQARGQVPLFLEFLRQAEHDPVVWQATVSYYRRYRALFAGMIDAGIAAGALKPADSELVARVAVSFAVGLLLQGLLDPDGADWPATAVHGMQMLLCALLNNAEKGKQG
jgi:AcrR family transcriptional regulator